MAKKPFWPMAIGLFCLALGMFQLILFNAQQDYMYLLFAAVLAAIGSRQLTIGLALLKQKRR